MDRLFTRGGRDLELAGRPRGPVVAIDSGESLCWPLAGRHGGRLVLQVEHGGLVKAGTILGRDPSAFDTPLRAPASGRVRCLEDEGLLRLDLEGEDELPSLGAPPEDPRGRRLRLVEGGVWSMIHEARSGRLCDPAVDPAAVLVSTLALEPFRARGDRLLVGAVDAFERGLGHLQSLLDYQPIHLILPELKSSLAEEIRQALRGKAWVRPHAIPRIYPHDHPALLARALGLHGVEGPIWQFDVAAVLALDALFEGGRPAVDRVLAVGGAVERPAFLRVLRGTPLAPILRAVGPLPSAGVYLEGGIFTGRRLPPEAMALDDGVSGLTVLEAPRPPRLFAFARPGFGLPSFFRRAFVGGWVGDDVTPLPSELGGESRACIACGACETLCPAGLMPALLHRFLWAEDLDEVERLRVDLCVDCGLCTWACPSKIELGRDFRAVRGELAAHRGTGGEQPCASS